MKALFKSLALVPLLFLIGCATPRHWVHQTKTEQAFYQDNSECLALASNAVGNTQVIPVTGPPGFATGFIQGWNQGAAGRAKHNQRTIYQHCLMGRGWQQQQKQY